MSSLCKGTFKPKLEGPAGYLPSPFRFMTFAYLMSTAMKKCPLKFLLSG